MCEVCKTAKKLGYKDVGTPEQPVLIRKDVDKNSVKVKKNKDGSITVEF